MSCKGLERCHEVKYEYLIISKYERCLFQEISLRGLQAAGEVVLGLFGKRRAGAIAVLCGPQN
jgi:hypothetical protein